jgi:hypothetical protein
VTCYKANFIFTFYFMNIVVSGVNKLWAGWTRDRIPVGVTGKHTHTIRFHYMYRDNFAFDVTSSKISSDRGASQKSCDVIA